MSIFSKNLRHLRESRGLKLDEFEFLGIKKGTMSNYELGNTEPKLSLLCEISKFFRISIDDFLLKDIEAEKITPVVTETAPPETANNNFIFFGVECLYVSFIKGVCFFAYPHSFVYFYTRVYEQSTKVVFLVHISERSSSLQ